MKSCCGSPQKSPLLLMSCKNPLKLFFVSNQFSSKIVSSQVHWHAVKNWTWDEKNVKSIKGEILWTPCWSLSSFYKLCRNSFAQGCTIKPKALLLTVYSNIIYFHFSNYISPTKVWSNEASSRCCLAFQCLSPVYTVIQWEASTAADQ